MKFTKRCKRIPGFITLPRSFGCNLEKNTQWPQDYSNIINKDVFAEQVKEMGALQQHIAQKVYDIMLATKEKELKLLKDAATPAQFTKTQVESYKVKMEDYAKLLDKASGVSTTTTSADHAAASSSPAAAASKNILTTAFPIELAVSHYRVFISERIESLHAQFINKKIVAAEVREINEANERAAQQQMMNRISTGENIGTIATKAGAKAGRLAGANAARSIVAKTQNVYVTNSTGTSSSRTAASSSSDSTRHTLSKNARKRQRRRAAAAAAQVATDGTDTHYDATNASDDDDDDDDTRQETKSIRRQQQQRQ